MTPNPIVNYAVEQSEERLKRLTSGEPEESVYPVETFPDSTHPEHARKCERLIQRKRDLHTLADAYIREVPALRQRLEDAERNYRQLACEVWCCRDDEFLEDQHDGLEGHKGTVGEIRRCNLLAHDKANCLTEQLAESRRQAETLKACGDNLAVVIDEYAKRTTQDQEQIDTLKADNERLKRGDFTPDELQNLCHNLSDKDETAFCDGCDNEQRKLFGTCRTDHLRNRIIDLESELRPIGGNQ